MKNTNTKRALLTSILSVMLCMAMLVGSTFAWFTDSVTSAGNIIKSGNLDVVLEWADGTETLDTAEWKDASTGAIFNYDLWEPGYTEVRHVKISNIGSLALKYEIRIAANGEVSKLADVLDVYYIKDGKQITDRAQLTDENKIGTLAEVLANPYVAKGHILAGENAADVATIALKMQETAGNEYQNLSIGSDFAVQLVATQYTAENDSFDDQYDAGAKWPNLPNLLNVTISKRTGSYGSLSLEDREQGIKISGPSNTVPPNTEVEFSVETIENTTDSITYELTLRNKTTGEEITPSNPVTVTLNIGKKLANVAVKHNGIPMNPDDYNYDTVTGSLTITTSSFSPFQISYQSNHRNSAKIGDKEYESLADAIADAKAGDTITLMQGYADQALSFADRSVDLKDITIDGANVTAAGIKMATNSKDKVNIENLTIKNLTLTEPFELGNYTTGYPTVNGLTFDNCVFDLSASTNKNNFGISLNGGTVKDKSLLDNVTVKNCHFKGTRRGIDISKARGCTVENCVFESCSTAAFYASDVLGDFTMKNNMIRNSKAAVSINTVANNYAATDYTAHVTITGNVMTNMTGESGFVLFTAYDNGRTAGKSTYTISDNYYGGADGVTISEAFRIKTNYGSSKAETIPDIAPRDSAE